MNIGEILRAYASAQQQFLQQHESGRALPAKRGTCTMSDAMRDLPVVIDGDDGFHPIAPTNSGIVGTLLKCVDGVWTQTGIPVPPGLKLLALTTTAVVRRWKDQRVIDTISKKPLPDPDQLNAAIPVSEWELDQNGQPCPPYELAWGVYLLDPETAEAFTFINKTFGAKIAVETLQNRVAWKRRLVGAKVVPEVELTSKPFKTGHGLKIRPEFKINPNGWKILDGGGGEQSAPQQLEDQAQPAQRGPKDAKAVSLGEEMNDEIGF
jgi:hypothetical protein